MAVTKRKPAVVVHHSDQGSQYTSLAFGMGCQEAGVRPGTGSVGDADDNALAEGFFATPECELLDRRRLRSQAEARMTVFRFIEGFYHPTILPDGIPLSATARPSSSKQVKSP